MTDFYFTFGSNQGSDPDGFIKITAPSELLARTAMWKLNGAKWAFCYTEETLKKEYFPRGEMAHFEFNPDLERLNESVPTLLYKTDGYVPLTKDYNEK